MTSSAARMSGIDVSHFQQEIDWRQVRRTGISFAFIKATEGTALADPMFRQNWTMARKAGILRGAYHFFRPQLDPRVQAQKFLSALQSDSGELPPVLDLETADDTPPQQVVAAGRRWVNVVEEALGCRPVLYTGSAFWRNTLRNSKEFARYPLWIAHYTSAPSPVLPSSWAQWTFWQFSQQGRVDGINGEVDLDVFNGSAADLEEFRQRCLTRNLQGASA